MSSKFETKKEEMFDLLRLLVSMSVSIETRGWEVYVAQMSIPLSHTHTTW